MMDVAFSVIIPLYNCKEYIKEAIDSVLVQEYKDYELIVINDGSTDGSEKIVDAYENPKIRLINQSNHGLFHTRLVGIKEAKYEYIIFLDADDKWTKNTLLEISHIIKVNSCDTVIFRVEDFWDNGKIKEGPKPFPVDILFSSDNINMPLLKLFDSNKINGIVCKAFKKSLIEYSELEYLPRITMGEDAILTSVIFSNMSSAYYTTKMLYKYRRTQNSMSSEFDINVFNGYKRLIEIFMELAKERFRDDENLLKSAINAIENKYLRMVASAGLYSKAVIKNKEKEFLKAVETVSNDEFYLEIINRHLKTMSFLVKIPNILIKTKKYKELLLLKKIISLIDRR